MTTYANGDDRWVVVGDDTGQLVLSPCKGEALAELAVNTLRTTICEAITTALSSIEPLGDWIKLECRHEGDWHYTVAEGVPLELQEKVLTDTLEMVRKKLVGGTAPPPGAEG